MAAPKPPDKPPAENLVGDSTTDFSLFMREHNRRQREEIDKLKIENAKLRAQLGKELGKA